ncbi:MAG: ABC transporter ATP-binding protein [Chloroflexia bacterium]|nr:ABC transporter ATP-binding protein [Chloroflexia bacterium]
MSASPTATASAALLEADNITKVFSGGLLHRSQLTALADFSFRVSGETPSITAIVGESGSGKTTLARLLLGLVTPTSGVVRYKGTDLQELDKEAQRAFLRDVQVIFQDPFEVYNPFYKVDHVLDTPIKNFGLANGRRARRALMEESLGAVGLRAEETLGRFPHQLSGGQRQRIMVARALLLRPKLIIADEPVSMVDASMRATILGSLQKLNREFGISVVYITHDLTTAYQISQDIIVLYRGSVAEVGNVETIVQEPQHPYTQLLVGSVPVPNPDHPWQGERALDAPTADLTPRGESFCPFHDRCPHTMPVCVEQHPPMFRTAPDRAVACYLYQESPTMPAAEMTSVITGGAGGDRGQRTGERGQKTEAV